MIVSGQEFSNEHFHITILTAPKCIAVIDDAKANTCACLVIAKLKHDKGKALPQDNDGKVRFTNCGKGKITLAIRTNNESKMDWHYFKTNNVQLFTLIKKVLEQTDLFHIKEGNLWEALYPTEDQHILELHRGVPRDLGKIHFQNNYSESE